MLPGVKTLNSSRFKPAGASRLRDYPVFKSWIQQSCGASECLQRASADHSGESLVFIFLFGFYFWAVKFNPSCRLQQYIHPGDAVKLGQAELLVIDEAAAIPLPLVKNLLGPYLVFMASTINGSVMRSETPSLFYPDITVVEIQF